MNNDLISREALKNLLNEYNKHFTTFTDIQTQIILDIIDNTSTVEERPQGEWIFLKANEEQTDGYECSACKATYHTRVPYFSEFNFCPNCGANMRKGGAE